MAKKPKKKKSSISVRKKATKPAKKAARKSKPKKKQSKPSAKAMAKPKAIQPRKRVGEVIHFYSNIGVAVVKVEDTLNVGDSISIEGATTNFRQKISSMQIDHDSVQQAVKGQEIGMKVEDKVREGDSVYKA